ncbi:dihydrofolate reductase family protein [Patulibacter americanus]|uniref:dihydrofolate reductase family protein n=1 Tax=Patulibacter americanus TaxID=588672 RepID=UPI0003B7B26C|nr:dihydrofolate reductase family protein [Patulibacter americanus]
MSTLLYSATMSLDGYIAGPGGDMSWLADHLGDPGPEVEDLMASIGALLIGRRTFDGDDPNRGTEKEGAFGGAWQGPSVVLTHDPPAPDDAPAGGTGGAGGGDPTAAADGAVTFATDLDTAVRRAKEAAGGRYVNVLGANVARQCVDAGLLDEVLVFIAPVLLGEGTPLFARPGGGRVRLEPLRPGDVGPSRLWFRVVR